MTTHCPTSLWQNNRHVNAALVSAHADLIFAEMYAYGRETAVGVQEVVAEVATFLEKAQLSVELDGDIGQDRAASWVESAARKVYGQGSERYADISTSYAVNSFRPLKHF